MTDMSITKTEQHTSTIAATLDGAAMDQLLEAAVRGKVGVPADQPGVTVEVHVVPLPDGSYAAAVKIVVDHMAMTPTDTDASVPPTPAGEIAPTLQ